VLRLQRNPDYDNHDFFIDYNIRIQNGRDKTLKKYQQRIKAKVAHPSS
jgi:hypothetical protein